MAGIRKRVAEIGKRDGGKLSKGWRESGKGMAGISRRDGRNREKGWPESGKGMAGISKSTQ